MNNLFRASQVLTQPSQDITPISVESALTMSLQAHHPANTSKRLFRCINPDCKKTFLYQSELNRHIQTHSNTRPHICPYPGCGKGFKRFDTLQTHYRLHTGEKPFICSSPTCGMGFSTKAALRYHSLKHSEKKVYKCDVPECGKSFLTMGQLKQHEKGKCHCTKAFVLENISDFSTVVSKKSTQLLFSLNTQESMSFTSPVAVTTAASDDNSVTMEPIMVRE
jgi:uncharacterized Zn-finger protein